MRRFPFAILFLAGLFVAPVVPACSSNGAVPSGGDAGDAGIAPNQVAGNPCDPTLSNPCLQGPPCFSVACVEGQAGTDICVETPLGGACIDPLDSGLLYDADIPDAVVVSSGCASNSDCPPITSTTTDGAVVVVATPVCGFSAFDNCSAVGVCVLAEPPVKPDGAVDTACGCDGQPVSYVTPTLTSAPVQSPTPCIAPVVDAGTDAGNEADAGADAATDAAQDAPTDAPADG